MGAMKTELIKLQNEVADLMGECYEQEKPNIYATADKIVWLVVERTLKLHGHRYGLEGKRLQRVCGKPWELP